MMTPSSSKLAKFAVDSNPDESGKRQEEADNGDVAAIDDMLQFGNAGEFVAEDYSWPTVQERSGNSSKTAWIPDDVTKACKDKENTWDNYVKCWRAVTRMIWKEGKRVKLNATRVKEYCDVLVEQHRFQNETQCVKKERLKLMHKKMMHYYFPKPPHRSKSNLPLILGICGGLLALAIIVLFVYWYFCKGSKSTGNSNDGGPSTAVKAGESKGGSAKPSATKSSAVKSIIKSNIMTNAKSKKDSQKSGTSKKTINSKK